MVLFWFSSMLVCTNWKKKYTLDLPKNDLCSSMTKNDSVYLPPHATTSLKQPWDHYTVQYNKTFPQSQQRGNPESFLQNLNFLARQSLTRGSTVFSFLLRNNNINTIKKQTNTNKTCTGVIADNKVRFHRRGSWGRASVSGQWLWTGETPRKAWQIVRETLKNGDDFHD